MAVFYRRDGSPDESVVRKMAAVLPHRGSEVTSQVSGSTAFAVMNHPGQTRSHVAIAEGRMAVFYGSLDNQAELSTELGLSEKANPAEILIGAFMRMGEDCLLRLRGSYSGAYSDSEKLIAFRDHFGSKPLFWGERDGIVCIGSESKQVLEGCGLQPQPDLEEVNLIFFGVPTTKTALRGVERVERGSLLRVSSGGSERHRYWDPRPLVETRSIDLEEAEEALIPLMEQAVRRAMGTTTVILLSGGVDSPTVAAFAVEEQKRSGKETGLKALSAFYPEHPAVDESRYIKEVASALGIEMHPYVPQGHALEDVEKWVLALGGPVDSIATGEVIEAYSLARDLGADTILTGELAEYAFEVRHYLMNHLVANRRWRSAASQAKARIAAGTPAAKVARQVLDAFVPRWAARAYGSIRPWTAPWLPQWLDPAYLNGGGTRPDQRRPAAERWSRLQTGAFFGQAISFEADEICAAHCGVEVRHPLGDVDLWEFLLSLPAEVKFPDATSKGLLRRVARGRVPDAILDRTDKTVFDDYAISRADYSTMLRWVTSPEHRLQGVNYEMLAERLETGDLSMTELRWAQDLTRVHAFLGQL